MEEDEGPDTGKADDSGAVEEGDGGQHDQEHQPHPHHQVDLLVHDVQGKDAQGVGLLQSTNRVSLPLY